jgi:hypothetical protein
MAEELQVARWQPAEEESMRNDLHHRGTLPIRSKRLIVLVQPCKILDITD